MWRMIGAVAALAMIGGCNPARAAPHDVGARPPGAFSYYMLALSWEQGYCDTAGRPDPGECSNASGFVFHGLWPELDGGDYPSFCGPQPLPDAERARSQGLYPSPSLIAHEWSKHGTCSGLAPTAYFKLSRADLARVTVPAAYRAARVIAPAETPALQQAFAAANPGLPADAVRAVVLRGEVTEVEICLTKAGAFRAC
jgi:ribonuclease T2